MRNYANLTAILQRLRPPLTEADEEVHARLLHLFAKFASCAALRR
jgi:hypothetical protein